MKGTSARNKPGTQPARKQARHSESAPGTVGQAMDKAQDVVPSLSGQTGHAFDMAPERVGQSMARITEQADDLMNDATRLIRDYPLMACLGAVGLGFLVGGLMSCPARASAKDGTWQI